MQKKSLLPLVLMVVVWAGFYIAQKLSVGWLNVFVAGAWVRFFTLIFLTIIIIVKGEFKKLLQTKHVFWKIMLIGVIGYLVDVCSYAGFQMSTAAKGAILLKIDILFANIVTFLFLKKRFSIREIIYSAAMLIGVFLVLNVNLSELKTIGMGDLFFIASALFITLNAFVIQNVQKNKELPINDNVIAYYNNLVVLILFTATSLAFGHVTLAYEKLADSKILLAVIAAAIGQTLVYVFYYYNLRRFPVWFVKVILLVVPVLTAIISILFLNENIYLKMLCGMIIVLGGAFGVIMEQQRKMKKAE